MKVWSSKQEENNLLMIPIVRGKCQKIEAPFVLNLSYWSNMYKIVFDKILLWKFHKVQIYFCWTFNIIFKWLVYPLFMQGTYYNYYCNILINIQRNLFSLSFWISELILSFWLMRISTKSFCIRFSSYWKYWNRPEKNFPLKLFFSR